jgi:hypothetical protein
MVGHVDRGIDVFQEHEITFHPFAEGEVFDINMSGSGSGFLSVTHCCAADVVLK